MDRQRWYPCKMFFSFIMDAQKVPSTLVLQKHFVYYTGRCKWKKYNFYCMFVFSSFCDTWCSLASVIFLHLSFCLWSFQKRWINVSLYLIYWNVHHTLIFILCTGVPVSSCKTHLYHIQYETCLQQFSLVFFSFFLSFFFWAPSWVKLFSCTC
jgi:hypothetical protein